MKLLTKTILITILLCLLTPLFVYAQETKFEDTKPTPVITIPGLKFSEVSYEEKTTPSGEQGTYLSVPYLGEYIVALYRWGVVSAGILSIIIIILGGLQWTISAGSPEKIKSAQKKIGGSIIGLTIALLSYMLLFIINPYLIDSGKLEILYIKEISIEEALESKTPGDSGDWENRHKKTSFLNNLENKISIVGLNILDLVKPQITHATIDIQSIISKVKNFYNNNPADYTKLNPSLSKNSTYISNNYIQSGACLEWNVKKLSGDQARKNSLLFAQHLKKTNIVSYAFYGRGAPCAKEKSGGSVENMCNDTTWGRFDCTRSMKTQMNNKSIAKAPWDLDYCLDCSGFTHTIFKCGAQKAIEAKTSLLFACDADHLKKYQIIPQSETKPGDIVGYRANKSIGISVGHVMVCLNNGCTQIIHVHGPQAYKKDNEGKALSIENNQYLKKLLQEKLERVRAYLYKKKGGKYNRWKNIESLSNADQKKLYTSRRGDGTSSYLISGKIMLPDSAIEEMQNRTGFQLEYRRLAVLDHDTISEISLPRCDYIEKYSMCNAYLKKLKSKKQCQ